MKLEQQVSSLEPSLKLKKLLVPQKGIFFFNTENKIVPDFTIDWSDGYDTERYPKQCQAFTVAELGEMLPMELANKEGQYYCGFETIRISGKNWTIGYKDYKNGKTIAYQMGTTEADARANMLIYLLENNLLTPVIQDNK